MFVNLSLRLVVDPWRDPGRLLVCVDTDGRPECGVFAGRFRGSVPGARQPTVEDPEWSGAGTEVFEIAGLPVPGESESLQYHFSVVSWKGSVYTEYPVGEELVVMATSELWHFAIRQADIILDKAYGRPV